jgi:hypothetical protein
MADAHKAPAATGGDEGSSMAMFIIKVLVGLLVFFFVILLIARDSDSTASFISFLKVLQVFAGLFILGGIITAIVMMRRFTPLNMALGEGYGAKYKPPTEKATTSTFSSRLAQVEAHMNADTLPEWKVGIIELDGILRDVLKEKGYPGETVADQLRGGETRPFASLENAWEAHKVRNRIAHDGMAFTMDKHEARRVYGLYKTVFEEFKLL